MNADEKIRRVVFSTATVLLERFGLPRAPASEMIAEHIRLALLRRWQPWAWLAMVGALVAMLWHGSRPMAPTWVVIDVMCLGGASWFLLGWRLARDGILAEASVRSTRGADRPSSRGPYLYDGIGHLPPPTARHDAMPWMTLKRLQTDFGLSWIEAEALLRREVHAMRYGKGRPGAQWLISGLWLTSFFWMICGARLAFPSASRASVLMLQLPGLVLMVISGFILPRLLAGEAIRAAAAAARDARNAATPRVHSDAPSNGGPAA